ncbi:hypothetical protein AQ490_15885 [Wenjunlia vitaminophila]|uniref:HTH araC/xylS-type domain-containing protein n=1 Tax=Wenjunlia vitaminophila TaxID=76728 RepID=A0A0T6LWW7_WENVI|nr:helix-turn-helix domain-containing protein [Wenjunlia vitaminophila]KRV50549.1 hypothetical protein AQ490_15885 [Wenjunlia vitaminophila]
MDALISHPQDSDLTVSERVERWRDYCLRLPVPVHVDPDLSHGFRVEMARADLGPVQALAMAVSSSEVRRTPHLIRRSSPDMLQLDLLLEGDTVLRQNRADVSLSSYGLVLYDASRPYRISSTATGDAVRGVVVTFPRRLLPLGDHQVEQSLATPLPLHDGPGALLSGYLQGLMANRRHYETCNADHLGSAVIDLLAALLSDRLDTEAALLPEARQRALRLQVRGFILRHLSDPRLDPANIAAAHHISVRYLHKLFQDEELKVADWIRQRRLERCRRDLGDPALLERPVHAIATHWGFPNAAHFSRAFRAAYDLSPSDYRNLALRHRSLHAEAIHLHGASTTF